MKALSHLRAAIAGGNRPPADIYVGLVRDLFAQSFTIGLITVLLACIGGYLAIVLADTGMAIAVIAGVLAGAARFAFVFTRQRRIQHFGLSLEEAERSERQFALLTYTFAASLGATAAFAFLSRDSAAQLLMLALLFAYGSGVSARLVLRPQIASWALAIVAIVVTPAVAAPMTLPSLILAAAFAAFLVGGLVLIRGSYRALIEQLLTRNEFARLARYDYLTGLPNRLLLREELDRVLSECEGDGCTVAVHHVDLDRFKAVNDTYGHPVGDELLKKFGKRLTLLLTVDDVASRFGGDEFVVLQTGSPSKQAVEEMALQIIAAAQTPFAIAGKQVSIGASVGVALAPQHGTDLDELIRCADVALYDAKDAGRDGFAAYNSDGTYDRLAS